MFMLTEVEKNIKFRLDNVFVERYKNVKPDFGFNGLGELVYMRTYSRIKPNGKNEQFYETIERVVNGAYSMQKRHIVRYGLGWDEEKGQKSAQEMYDRMFKMKFLPPGRGLWAMGTSITEEKGLHAALNNCAFTSTEEIDKEPTKPFEFLMDMSMLGVGVGFDVKGAGRLRINTPLDEKLIYTIPDTREGWVESLKVLLMSYFDEDRPTIEFDYSEIRPFGSLIKTFGGKASGPDPLMKLHEQIRTLFENRGGSLITITDITDIMNMIGCCVVAGNVRRTAEIVFGPHDDEEYLKLKDYKWDEEKGEMVGESKHRSEYGWASNNSIFSKVGMDYNRVGKQTAVNGEPGYAWLENMRAYGRMCEEPNWKDHKVAGGNPCLEQSLESFELCCLVETFPSRSESPEDYKRTLKFAYLYAKTVTLGQTHWPETNKVMLRNRRIGTSMSGIAQYITVNGIENFRQLCTEGYETIQYYDEVYSDWLCVPKSIKTTSIKPSGTVSLLPGVTPGMHYPENTHYIRRVRIGKSSHLWSKCQEAGFHVEDDVMDPSSKVVEIPVHVDNVRTVNEVSIWEQVSLAAFMQKYWADNQVSCTVTFKPEEGDQIPMILDYFQYQLKGISFLPKTEIGTYPQMPYEEITKERYEELTNNVKPLDFKDIGEDSTPELYCDGDTCIIP